MPRKPKKSPVRRTPAVRKTPSKNTTVPPSAVAVAVEAKPVVVTPVVAKVEAPKVEAVKAEAVVAKPAVAVVPAFPSELVEQLRHPAVETAVDAAAALARTGDARVVPALVSTLENNDGYCHVVVRAAAAMALGKFNTPESIDALLIAACDSMAEVSSEAILALGELKAAKAADLLITIVSNSNGFYLNTTRHAAVRALGRLKVASAAGVLKAVADSQSEDAAVVAAAREALA